MRRQPAARPANAAADANEPAPEPGVTSLGAPLLGAQATRPALRSSRLLSSAEAPPVAAAAPAVMIFDNTWTRDALREECRRRGLPVGGLKADLTQRLNTVR